MPNRMAGAEFSSNTMVWSGTASSQTHMRRYGGGVALFRGGTVRNCLIAQYGNRASDWYGGGVHSWGGTIENCR